MMYLHGDLVYVGNVNPIKIILPILGFIFYESENDNRGEFFCLIHVIFKLCFTVAVSQTFYHEFLSQNNIIRITKQKNCSEL
jgi:hypothetical protein